MAHLADKCLCKLSPRNKTILDFTVMEKKTPVNSFRRIQFYASFNFREETTQEIREYFLPVGYMNQELFKCITGEYNTVHECDTYVRYINFCESCSAAVPFHSL